MGLTARSASSLSWVALAAALGVSAPLKPASAQEMEPKAYSASPAGAGFLVLGLGRSSGAVVFDPTLPFSDVEARINAAAVGVGYTFDLFGKLALVSAALPYSWGDVSGKVAEEARSITRSGLADSRYKLSVNLVGNPAMGAREFAKTPRRTIIGTSLTVMAPSGQYDDAKLINLGTNRWAFKPEVGLAVPRGRWDFDAYVGVWLLSANDDFFPGGLTRTQDPVVAVQGHVSYTFKPRLWTAFDATWYRGGAATVEDGDESAGVANSRLGATLSLPVGRRQSFKVAYSSGVSVRTGTDFRTFAVGWQWLFLTRP
jgi:hypothetical protein